jgi:hypothetical protein
VRAHQDDSTLFKNLSRKAQLNCICNHTAKQCIAIDGSGHCQSGSLFLLEMIGMFIQGEKLTSDTGDLFSGRAGNSQGSTTALETRSHTSSSTRQIGGHSGNTPGTATAISALGS